MIVSKDIKLELDFPITNELIETKLDELGLNVLRWAVVDVVDNVYTIRVSIVIN